MCLCGCAFVCLSVCEGPDAWHKEPLYIYMHASLQLRGTEGPAQGVFIQGCGFVWCFVWCCKAQLAWCCSAVIFLMLSAAACFTACPSLPPLLLVLPWACSAPRPAAASSLLRPLPPPHCRRLPLPQASPLRRPRLRPPAARMNRAPARLHTALPSAGSAAAAAAAGPAPPPPRSAYLLLVLALLLHPTAPHS